MLKLGFILFLILIGSFPGNLAIIHYINEKPEGNKTILDTTFKDFFYCNIFSVLLHCSSLLWVSIFGPILNHLLVRVLSWAIFYLAVLALSAAISSCIMRYMIVLKHAEIQNMDEWFLTLMIRTSVTLPPTLMTAHYYTQGIEPPFFHYLNTTTRPEEANNELIYLKGAMTALYLIGTIFCGLMTYLEMKEALRFEKTWKKQPQISSKDESKQIIQSHIKKFRHVLFMVILALLTLLNADYPMGFDYNSSAYLFGMIQQGIFIPFWFLTVYPECFNYVIRDAHRRWPLNAFVRLQRSSNSRA